MASINKHYGKSIERSLSTGKHGEQCNFIERNKLSVLMTKEDMEQLTKRSIEAKRAKIRANRQRKQTNDKNEQQYKYQQANRGVIQKIIRLRGNALMNQKAELRRRVITWVGMAVPANVCQKIDRKRRIIMARIAHNEKRDQMARRIQGFVLREMYRKSVAYQSDKASVIGSNMIDEIFKLDRRRHPILRTQFLRAREFIN